MLSTSLSLSTSDLERAIALQPISVAPDLLVTEAIALLSAISDPDARDRRCTSCLAVVNGTQLVGLFSEREALQLVASGRSLAGMTLAEAIASPIATLQYSELINPAAALRLLQQHQIQYLPVLDDEEQLVGLLTYESICRLLQPVELEQQVEQSIADLTAEVQQSHLLLGLTAYIHSATSLANILHTMVVEVRRFLGCDRVSIYRFLANGQFQVAAEALDADRRSFVNENIHDPCFSPNWIDRWGQPRVQVVADIYQAEMTPCHVELLERLQIRAQILVPVLINHQLWGIISASESAAPRDWQPKEVRFLQELSMQVAIAIEDSQTKTLLHQQRQELEALLDRAPDVIFRLDRDLHYLYVNKAVRTELGYAPEALIGKSLLVSTLAPEYLAQWRTVAHRVAITGQEETIEYQLHTPHRDIWFQTRVVPESGMNGTVTSFLCMARNITQQKQTEARQNEYIDVLIEWQNRYHAAQQASGQALYEWDVSGDYFTWGINTEQVLGYSASEMPRTLAGFLARIHPEDVEQVQAATEEYLDIQGHICLQYRWRHRDGHYLWIEDQAQFFADSEGNFTRVVGYIADISDRKQAEAALRESQELNERILESSYDCIKLLTPEGQLLFINEGGMASLEIDDATSILNTNWVNLWQGEDKKQAKAAIAAAKAGNLGRFQGFCPTFKGQPKWWDNVATPLRDATGKIAKLVVISRDITEQRQVQAALEASEAKYRQLFNSIDEGFCIIEMIFDENQKPVDYRFLELSPSFEKQSGLVNAQGKLIREMVPNIEEHWFEIYGNIALTGEPVRFENQAEQLNRWYDVYAFRVGEPKARQVAVLFQDISDRRQLELALRESKTQLKQIIDNSNDVFFLKSLDSKQMIYASATWEELYQTPLQQIYDNPQAWLDFVHPDDRDRAIALNQQINQGETVGPLEYRIVRPDGSIRWIWNRTFPIRNAAGEVYRHARINTDISDRKQAEEALKASQQQLQRMTETVPGVIYQCCLTPEGILSFPFISQRMVELYELTPEQIKTNPQLMWDIIHPDDLEGMQQSVATSAANLELWHFEYRIQTASGITKWILGQSVPILENDGTIFWIGYISDISDRKQVDAELRQREEFLRSIYTGADQAIFVVEAIANQEFRYLEFNPVAQLYGSVTNEEIRGKTPEEVFGQVLGSAMQQQYVRCMQAGQKISYEENILLPEQSLWTLTTLFPIQNEQGEIYRIIGTAIDITERKQAELERQRSEAILQAFMTASPISMTILDHDLRFLYINEAMAALNNLPLEAHFDRTLWDIVPDIAPQFAPMLLQVMETQEPVLNVEFTGEIRPGVFRSLITNHYPVCLPNGEVIGVGIASMDVTELVQTQQELRESEEQLRLAFEASRMGNWDWNIQTGEISWSANMEAFFGLKPGEFDGSFEMFIERVHPDDCDRVQAAVHQAIATKEDYEIEFRIVYPNGTIRWSQGKGKVFYDSNGQPMRMVGVDFDITDRKQAELERQRSEAMLQAFIAASPIAMTLFDRDLRFLYGNEALAELNGLPLSEHLGRTLWDVVPEIAPQFAPMLLQIMETQEPVLNVEFSGEVRPDVFRSTVANHYPVSLSNGEVIGVGVAVMDITARKQAEIALAEQEKRYRYIFDSVNTAIFEEDFTEIKATIEQLKAEGVTDFQQYFAEHPEFVQQAISQVQIRDVNQAALRMFKAQDKAQLLLTSLPQMFVPETQATFVGELLAIAQEETLFSAESEVQTLEGDRFNVWVTISFPPAGEPYDKILVSLLDITEQKRSEAALRESEARFRTLADNISQFAWMTDENGWIFWYNQRWFDYTGTTLEQMQGWGWQQVHHPDHVKRVVEKISRCFETGESWEDTFPLRGKDGKYRWFLSRALPIRDQQGRVQRWFGTNTDITELRETEIALQKTTERLNLAIRSAPISLSSQDLDLRYTWMFNPKYYSVEEFIGRRDEDLTLPETAAHLTQLKQQVIETGIGLRQEVEIKIPKTQKNVYFDLTIDPLWDSQNAIVGITCAAVNISDRKEAEAALRDTQEFNQRILESSNDCIKVLNLEGDILFINGNGMSGLEITDITCILNANWVKFWPLEDQEQAQVAIAAARAGNIGRFQGFCPTSKGNPKWWDVAITPLRDATRQVVKLVAISRDITEQKQAEAALAASEQRYRYLTEAMPQMVWMTDRTGGITYFNQRWYTYTGLSQAESMGLGAAVVIHPEDRDRMMQQWGEAVALGRSFEIEVRFQHYSGIYRWFISRGLAIRNPEGETTGWIGTITDIDDFKRAVLVRQQLESRFRAMFEQAAVGIAETDFSGRFLRVNRRVCELFGYTEAEMLEQNFQSLTPRADDLAINLNYRQQLFASEIDSFSLEKHIRHKNGDLRWYNITASPIRNADGIIESCIGVVQDIEDRKQAQLALQQLNQELETRITQRTAALSESEARYRALFEQAAVGITRCDLSGQYIQVNQRFCDLIGYSQSELLTLCWQDLIHPDDGDATQEDIIKLRTGKITSITAEIRYIRKDGYFQWVSITVSLLHDAQGTLISDLAVIEDISDRKHIEQKLQNSEKRLKEIISKTVDGILILNLHGQILFANPAAEKIFECSRPYCQGEILGLPITLQKRFELEIPRCNGRVTTVEIRVEEITWQERKAFLAAVRDISDRKQAEIDLQASELSYRTLAENLPGIVYKLYPDQENKIVFFNDRLTTLLGLKPEELTDPGINCRIEPLIVPEDRDRVVNTIRYAIASKQPFQVNYWIQNPKTKEKKYFLEQGCTVIDDSGQSLHVVGIIFDVTETKRTEKELRNINEQLTIANAELARATRLKDEFLANMSHELRTPLNSILGLSEVLQEKTYGDLTEHQHRALTTIKTNGQHLLALINDILDLAKIESGKLDLQLTSVSIQQLCRSTLPFIQQQTFNKQINFTLELAANLEYIEVDDRLIRQALINLLNNAVKFTPSGGSITLKVQGNRIGKLLYLSVIDTGIGIAPEDIDKLFKPFIQVDSSLSRRYSGTGLGLALVRRIVELHKGQVTITSTVGQGSEFTIILPWINTNLSNSDLSPSDTSAAKIASESSYIETKIAAQKPVVLLVEDNMDNIETLTAYLELKGFTIVVARNGGEAVRISQAQSLNLILMDIQMPDMDGLEAISQIRAGEQEHRIPIVAVTALAMPGDKEKCLAAGADDYLSKPISPIHLVSVMKKHLQ